MLINKYLPENNTYNDKKLYRVGIIAMLSIILHNIPEGIATFMASTSNIKLGLTLALAIALHNIPEGISISVPIYYATNSKKKAFLYTFISGISEFFGAVLTYFFLKNFINDFLMGALFASIAGIMFYIGIYELLPTSFKYKKNKPTLF
jgi:ZIP family zinc transporter